jgi:hypothetical protein
MRSAKNWMYLIQRGEGIKLSLVLKNYSLQKEAGLFLVVSEGCINYVGV